MIPLPIKINGLNKPFILATQVPYPILHNFVQNSTHLVDTYLRIREHTTRDFIKCSHHDFHANSKPFIVSQSSDIMFKTFIIICLSICILSRLNFSVGMESSDGCGGKGEIVSTPYDVDNLAIDIYQAFEGNNMGRASKGNTHLSSKLSEIEASDESMNEFMVVKRINTKNVSQTKTLIELLKKYKDDILRRMNLEPLTNVRPSHMFSPKNIYQQLEISLNSALVYAYVNLDRYSHEEVVTCINNAYATILDECSNSDKARTCLVSSLVCGMYYGVNDKKQSKQKEMRYINVDGKLYCVEK
jgi:hypothetical protein